MGSIIVMFSLLVISVTLLIISNHSRFDILEFFGIFGSFIFGLAFVAMLIIAITVNVDKDAETERFRQRYDSLYHQVSTNMYSNDNEIGKKELANQIQKWNEDLAFRKIASKNFWINVYYPHDYEQFEFIPYELLTSKEA